MTARHTRTSGTVDPAADVACLNLFAGIRSSSDAAVVNEAADRLGVRPPLVDGHRPQSGSGRYSMIHSWEPAGEPVPQGNCASWLPRPLTVSRHRPVP